MRLNSTFIRHARFSPVGLRLWSFFRHGVSISNYENDSWSVLRQLYAGPRVLIQLLFLISFAMPYIGRVVWLKTVAETESRVAEFAKKEAKQLPDGELTRRVQVLQTDLDHRLVRHHIVTVLLHLDKEWYRTLMAGLLVLYNLAIFTLIISVGPLRDQEERSGYSPAWSEYGCPWWVSDSRLRRFARGKSWLRFLKWPIRPLERYGWMILLHWFVTVVFYVSLAAFFWNVGELLFEPIWVPR